MAAACHIMCTNMSHIISKRNDIKVNNILLYIFVYVYVFYPMEHVITLYNYMSNVLYTSYIICNVFFVIFLN